MPRHVAIIMDGNGRWASQRGLPRRVGHWRGAEAARSAVRAAVDLGLSGLTLFAFSSENWKRPVTEVVDLMGLLRRYLGDDYAAEMARLDVRVRMIGDRSAFSPQLQEHMAKAEALTRDNTAMTLVIAANYGGQWDITQATQKVAARVAAGELTPSDITEDVLQQHLSIGDLPMPDLMIRTAGEQRISNFLLWHLAYTEFYFCDVYWPDFGSEQMRLALDAYARRKRRFGQTDDQVDQRLAAQQ